MQVENIVQGFQVESKVIASQNEPIMQLWVKGAWVGKIVEGCNAMSVIILFSAFIIAFAKRWKKTLLFIIAGSILIYTVNLIRISILAIALYEYPQHQELLHSVVFPGIIYSMVFVLWIVWVRNYQAKKKAHA